MMGWEGCCVPYDGLGMLLMGWEGWCAPCAQNREVPHTHPYPNTSLILSPFCGQMIPAILAHPLEDLPKHCHFMPGVPVKPMLAKATNAVS